MRARVVSVAALAAASIGLAAGCSSSTGSTAAQPGAAAAASQVPSPAASAVPANPVPIVKLAGAKTSAVNGDVDVYGDRYAQGDIPGATVPGCSESFSVSNGSQCLESVEVYTYATAADQATWESRNSTPSDSNTVISGHLFDLTLYPVATDTGPWVYPVSVATVAKRVGGKVLAPAS